MSARRMTNNSSVSSLEEQTEVISATLGLPSSISQKPKVTSSEKSKASGKSKKVKASSKPSSEKTPAPGSARASAPGSDVTAQPARASAGASGTSPIHVANVSHGGLLGALPGNDQSQDDQNNDDQQPGAAGLAFGIENEDLNDDNFWAQQQQWLWQQQQLMGFPYGQPGMFPQQPWFAGPTGGVAAPVQEGGRPTSDRQPTHAMSEDEEEIEIIASVQGEQADEGLTVGLVKEQLGQFKDPTRPSLK